MKSGIKTLDLFTRIIAAAIFAYSAYMKIIASPESIEVFRRIGLEPYGRYGVAALECIVIVLLIIPKTAWRGAVLGALMMFGAIGMHIMMNEIIVLNDGGLMFSSAIIVFICCIGILIMHKTEIEADPYAI